MSSKSRKNSPASGSRARRPAEDVLAASEKEEHDELDELLRAPKETSKLKFALMIALVIFLLIIFIVPSAFQGLGTSVNRDDPEAFAWERPGVGREVVTASELSTFHYELEEARLIDRLIPFTMSFDEPDSVSLRDAARLMVLAQLAHDSGISVSNADLGNYLNERVVKFWFNSDTDAYRQAIQSRRTKVEETIRTCVAIQRLLQMTGYAASLPHPNVIEEFWENQHEEVELQYLKVAASEFEEAARSELPDDAELEAWLLAKPENEQRAYFSDERRTIEAYLYVDQDTTPATGLVEAFPGAADAVAEDQARNYYDRVHFRRFLQPKEEGDEEASSPFDTRDSIPFEEVKDVCLVEAPIYDAMQAWLGNVRARLGAGEEVDLAAEATAHGLMVVTLDDVTRADLADHEVVGNNDMINTLFATSADDISFLPAWTEGVAGFGRTLERVAPSLPPFEEIRDEVADDWVAPRAEELATEHMQGLYEQLETFEPEEDRFDPQAVYRRASDEEFAQLAADSGLAVNTREYLDRGGDPQDDPNFEEDDNAFLWSRREFSTMEVGEVAAPAVGNGDTVYLVRVSGKRPVSLDGMSPRDYQQFQRSARTQAANPATLAERLDLDYFEKYYGLVELYDGMLATPEELAEAEEEDAGAES